VLYICVTLTRGAKKNAEEDALASQTVYDEDQEPIIDMVPEEEVAVKTIGAKLDRDTDSFFVSFELKLTDDRKTKKKMDSRITFQFLQTCIDK